MANAIRQDTPRGGRAAIESHPWHETALGPMRDWPASLTSAVDLVLSLPMSAAILWSDQLVEVPNEHFLCFAEETVVGMGRLATEAWPDRWPGGAVVWETVLSGRTVSVKVEDEGPQFTFGPLCDERERSAESWSSSPTGPHGPVAPGCSTSTATRSPGSAPW